MARDNKKERALSIRDNINLELQELDKLIESTDTEASKATLLVIQAQLTQKIELKQKALSNEINNHLFKVLEIVGERLESPMLSPIELKDYLQVLKDCSAIVGLTGKTPLIAQQFNNINNQIENESKEKIQAIEVEILDSETKD